MSKYRLIPCLAAALIVSANVGTTALADNHSSKAAGEQSLLKSVPSGKYDLDKGHAYINFQFSHLGFSNPTLGFRDFDVEMTLDNDNLKNSTLIVTIDVNSIDSRVAKFDKHLVSDDMFDTAKFPTATFIATDFVKTSADTMDITGDLTIKETTLPVTLKAKINKAANHPMRKVPTIGVSASTVIKRSDFGVSYATPHVGDDVTINIEVEMPKAK